MQTLDDLFTNAEAAHAAGNPWVANWLQARASFHLLARARDLSAVPIQDFEAVFPAHFHHLSPDMQSATLGHRAYDIAQRQIARVVASAGFLDNTWEMLRVLMRNEGLGDREQQLSALRTAAIKAGKSVSDITPEWVWDRDAILGVGVARMRLRRSVVVFDQLFLNDTLRESSLLPKAPIGPPPKYDSLGRAYFGMPASLKEVAEQCGPFRSVWQAVCASGDLILPADPKPEDLLEPRTWARIRALPHDGICDRTWTLYLQRVRKALFEHASALPADPDGLPSSLQAAITTPEERIAIKGLWAKILATGDPTLRDRHPSELLALETWRSIWKKVQLYSALTERTYEMHARKALLRCAPDQVDPLWFVIEAWNRLPRAARRHTVTLRKSARRALLTPDDVSHDWLVEQVGPEAGEMILSLLHEARRQQEEPAPPEASWVIEWDDLRSEARSHGINTNRLGTLSALAIAHEKGPRDIDREWITEMSDPLDHSRRAKLSAVIRTLDTMRVIPALLPMLPAAPIGQLQDKRRAGNVDLPDQLSRELDAVEVAYNRAPNTRRADRTLVRGLYTTALREGKADPKVGLRELLMHAPGLDVTPRTKHRAKCLLMLTGSARTTS